MFTMELTTQVTLIAAALIGLAIFARRTRERPALYWLVFASGMLYLAFDERFGFHERMGTAIEDHLFTAPFIQDTDALVLASFALAGFAVTAVFRDEFLRHPPVLAMMALGVFFTCLAFGLDAFVFRDDPLNSLEEPSEWLAALGFTLAAAARLAIDVGVRVPGRERGLAAR